MKNKIFFIFFVCLVVVIYISVSRASNEEKDMSHDFNYTSENFSLQAWRKEQGLDNTFPRNQGNQKDIEEPNKLRFFYKSSKIFSENDQNNPN